MELLASWKANSDRCYKNVRYYSPISIDLFYSPPMMRTFLWEDEVGNVYPFSMNLPHSYFTVSHVAYDDHLSPHKFYCYGSREKITHLKERVFALPLPHVDYSSGYMCLGRIYDFHDKDQLINEMMNKFFYAKGYYDYYSGEIPIMVNDRYGLDFFKFINKSTPKIWSYLPKNITMTSVNVFSESKYDCTYNLFEK